MLMLSLISVPSIVAVMVAEPMPTAFTFPLLSTAATDSSEDE
jgi:hypothetical protein